MRLAPDRADWTALAKLHRRAFEGAQTPWSACALEAFARSPGAALFVVQQRPADGFALTRAAADEVELATLAVDPQARRRGRGAALLRAVCADAQERGAAAFYLEVAEINMPALALYIRTGFHEVGRRTGYYRAPGKPAVDALILRLAFDR